MNLSVDIKDFIGAANAAKMTKYDMTQVAGAGAKMVINNQRRLVPVDTSATQNSIREYVIKVTDSMAEVDIGPDTEYAPAIEYGRRDMPSYPMQPFIRPSVRGRDGKEVIKVIKSTLNMVIAKWR